MLLMHWFDLNILLQLKLNWRYCWLLPLFKLSIQCVINEQKKTTWWVAQVPTDRKLWFMMIFCITLHLFNMPNWRWALAQQEFTAHTIASLSLSNDRLMTSINWFDKKIEHSTKHYTKFGQYFFYDKNCVAIIWNQFFFLSRWQFGESFLAESPLMHF